MNTRLATAEPMLVHTSPIIAIFCSTVSEKNDFDLGFLGSKKGVKAGSGVNFYIREEMVSLMKNLIEFDSPQLLTFMYIERDRVFRYVCTTQF